MASTASNPWSVNTRTIVLAAIFGAMVVALQIVGIGSIPVPNLSGAMTTLLIPVILGALIGGPIVGMFAGLVMGIIYLILPATAAFGPITLIVPRLVFALVAWAVYRALKPKTNTVVASAVAGAAGALTNTVTAVGIAILLGQVPASIIPAIIPQAAIELVGCAIIIPIVMVAVEASLKARTA
ncbi:MAG: ECF transporter S component [Thermoflexales bacterium]|nr:ECF transporter S component [Thermoflexales bacterium]MDW8350572.1 ECF transporter S component [Anaerolineae bacterium]